MSERMARERKDMSIMQKIDRNQMMHYIMISDLIKSKQLIIQNYQEQMSHHKESEVYDEKGKAYKQLNYYAMSKEGLIKRIQLLLH